MTPRQNILSDLSMFINYNYIKIISNTMGLDNIKMTDAL